MLPIHPAGKKTEKGKVHYYLSCNWHILERDILVSSSFCFPLLLPDFLSLSTGFETVICILLRTNIGHFYLEKLLKIMYERKNRLYVQLRKRVQAELHFRNRKE